MPPFSRRRFLQSTPALAALGALPATATAADAPKSASEPPPFHLGLVTYNIAADWDLPTLLKVCKQVGLTGVEFRTSHKHRVEVELAPEERKSVRKQCEDAGIKMISLGSVCEFHSPDRAVVEQQIETCKQFARLAADLGAKGVKVRPNGLPKDVPVEKTLAQIGQALVKCGQAAADLGVEIWVEVHGSGTSLPKNMKTIMEQCGHPAVGINWNSNPTDLVNGSVTESFQMLKPWLKACHINELYKNASGAYPYRTLFQLMREAGYNRYTLCEVGKTPKSVEDGTEILRYYKGLWQELARK